MNGFEMHGITHFSASKANLAQNCLPVFILEYLLGKRGGVGAAAHRGTAAEAGIAMGLKDPTLPVEDCVAHARKEYARLTALSADPNRVKEGEAMSDIVVVGLETLRPYGIPSHFQRKIEYKHPDLPIPFIGYTDFEWEDHGILIDLKTQLRLASEISTNHARQVALYKSAISDNLDARIAYVTPKKAAVYALENYREHMAALVKVAQAVERFLRLSKDPKELAGLIAPDFESFYFNNPQTRRDAFEVWGY